MWLEHAAYSTFSRYGSIGMELECEMILFLDFDGVLHPRAPGKALFSNLARLEAVLREFEFVEVVITSTWRENMSFEELQALFSPDIRPRVIGVTPVVEIEFPAGPHGTREEEIRLFLEQGKYQERSWLALDDEERLFQPGGANLVICPTQIGFDEEAEKRLRKRLQADATTKG